MQKSPPPHLFAVALRQLANSPELVRTTKDAGLYDGYLSALGPTVRLLGLLPALANYTADTKSARSKAPLLRYLQNILADPEAKLFAPPDPAAPDAPPASPAGITVRSLAAEAAPTLFGKVSNLSDAQRQVFKHHFYSVLVAAKLALRSHLPLSRNQPGIIDEEE